MTNMGYNMEIKISKPFSFIILFILCYPQVADAENRMIIKEKDFQYYSTGFTFENDHLLIRYTNNVTGEKGLLRYNIINHTVEKILVFNGSTIYPFIQIKHR